MALKDYYYLATNNSEHRATVGGAAFEAANAILNEDTQTANHENRKKLGTVLLRKSWN